MFIDESLFIYRCTKEIVYFVKLKEILNQQAVITLEYWYVLT